MGCNPTEEFLHHSDNSLRRHQCRVDDHVVVCCVINIRMAIFSNPHPLLPIHHGNMFQRTFLRKAKALHDISHFRFKGCNQAKTECFPFRRKQKICTSSQYDGISVDGDREKGSSETLHELIGRQTGTSSKADQPIIKFRAQFHIQCGGDLLAHMGVRGDLFDYFPAIEDQPKFFRKQARDGSTATSHPSCDRDDRRRMDTKLCPATAA